MEGIEVFTSSKKAIKSAINRARFRGAKFASAFAISYFVTKKIIEKYLGEDLNPDLYNSQISNDELYPLISLAINATIGISGIVLGALDTIKIHKRKNIETIVDLDNKTITRGKKSYDYDYIQSVTAHPENKNWNFITLKISTITAEKTKNSKYLENVAIKEKTIKIPYQEDSIASRQRIMQGENLPKDLKTRLTMDLSQ